MLSDIKLKTKIPSRIISEMRNWEKWGEDLNLKLELERCDLGVMRYVYWEVDEKGVKTKIYMVGEFQLNDEVVVKIMKANNFYF